MGIGTSLGAYFETELDHHAGHPAMDDNVADSSGDQLTQDQNTLDSDVMIYNRLLKDQGPIRYPNNFQAADDAMQLTDQEKNLYQMHLHNLDQGGVKNEDGSTSTLLQQTFEFDTGTENARTYNVPSVFNGKVNTPEESSQMASKLGWDKFPNYSSQVDAQGRYDQMHKFMEQDTMNYELAARKREKPL